MTQVSVNGSDRATLRLLHLDLPPEAVERFTQMAGTGEWPLKYALGAERLRESFVDVVAIKDLQPMTLSQYLGQAYDVGSAVLGGDVARLDGLRGHVVVLPPQVWDGQSQTLSISPPLTLIGTYGSAAPTARGPKVTSDSARGGLATGTGAAPGEGGSRVLTLILGALALALLAAILLFVL